MTWTPYMTLKLYPSPTGILAQRFYHLMMNLWKIKICISVIGLFVLLKVMMFFNRNHDLQVHTSVSPLVIVNKVVNREEINNGK